LQEICEIPTTQTRNPNTQNIENPNPDLKLWVFWVRMSAQTQLRLLFVRNGPRTISSLLDQRLVVLASLPRVNGGPARLTIILQTRDIGAKEGRKLAATPIALTLIAHLIVQHVRLHLHPLVDLAMLQLHEPRTDRRDVALLVGEGHASRALRTRQKF